jgi:small subunit ribosomal protein S1
LPEKDSELESLLDVKISPAPLRSPHVGEIVETTIRAVSEETITLKTDELTVYVPTEDARPVGEGELPKPGSKQNVLLEDEEEAGVWTGSLHRAQSLKIFEDILVAANEEQSIEATITVALRNGFAATWKDLRCFVPARESGIPRRESFEHIGKTYTFDIKDFDRKTCQLILTRKERADEQKREARKAAFDKLSVGQIIEGTVANILDFGAFIDIGGADGLLHISETSLQHLEHPSEVLNPGEKVKVKVISLDPESLKIGLSRKDILRDVYQQEVEALEVDRVYEGTVSSLVDFGAFIELKPGIEGLCHISEIRWTEHVEHPSEVLEVGETVKVRLLSKDPEEQRLSLSIRQVEENPWSELLDEHPPGSVVEGTITRIEDYGLFIEIAEGIEGLCHVSDLSWEERPETPLKFADYAVGDAIEVKVLDIDINRQRIGLGVKHLTTDPWDEAGERVNEGAIYTARVTRFGNDAAYLTVAPGLEGRLHISEVSTDRVDSIRSSLRIGQEVDVMTVNADRKRRRLDLSIKAIMEKRLREQPSSFDEGGAMNPLSEAFAAKGFTTTTEVEAEEELKEKNTATESLDEFATDADLIEGFEAQVAGLKEKGEEEADAEADSASDATAPQDDAPANETDTDNVDEADEAPAEAADAASGEDVDTSNDDEEGEKEESPKS